MGVYISLDHKTVTKSLVVKLFGTDGFKLGIATKVKLMIACIKGTNTHKGVRNWGYIFVCQWWDQHNSIVSHADRHMYEGRRIHQKHSREDKQ